MRCCCCGVVLPHSCCWRPQTNAKGDCELCDERCAFESLASSKACWCIPLSQSVAHAGFEKLEPLTYWSSPFSFPNRIKGLLIKLVLSANVRLRVSTHHSNAQNDHVLCCDGSLFMLLST